MPASVKRSNTVRWWALPCPVICSAVLLMAASVLSKPSTAQTIAPANRPPTLVRPVQDLTISAGVPFKFSLRPSGQVFFGYDVGGEDIRVTDNYFANHVRFFKPWKRVTFSGNTVIGRDESVVSLDMTGSDPDAYVWDRNRYFARYAQAFGLAGRQSWNRWRVGTSFDRESRFSQEVAEATVFVRPNRFESGRGHVIVYNWDRAEEVEADLSQLLDVGSKYEIHNVLNLDGEPVVRGVFDGKKIALPMQEIAMPIPKGHRPPAPLILGREFSVFLIKSSDDRPTSPSKGRAFYVSTRGTPDGNGTMANPWDLQTALQHPASVSPGDTIWIRGGTYRGEFSSQLMGAPDAPIIVRALSSEDVRVDLFDPNTQSGASMSLAGRHCWYWGFEIFSSDASSRKTMEAGSWPESVARGDFIVSGDHIKLINLTIHDLRQGLGFWSAGTGGEANGLIIYNNGWMGPDRNHGHAIYTQNEGATRRLVDNILFNQFRNGIMVYGSAKSVLKDYHIEGNVSFANGGAVGEGYVGSFQLLVGGGSLAEHITVTRNFTYDLPNHFRDPDFDDPLAYAAECADGQPLPKWLNFAGNEGYFYGTPGRDDVGAIEIRVTASDQSKASAEDLFLLRVIDGPPELAE